ncbi:MULTISPECIES: hypothetical protein [unclassified Arthrobacter]|uniref:hypothetical protein n=1 Tax=unclassified Arthrobacter TaxID=235627 RepID=UPI0033942461
MTLNSNPGETATQVVGMIAALSHIDSAGFHGIDMELRGESPIIDEFWSSRARAAQIAAASISWPDQLRPQAKLFSEVAGRLAAALSAGDAKAAAHTAREAHSAWHTLNTPAWSYLAKTAGLRKAGDTNQHQHQHQAP